jgi:hypothetical protein
MHRYRLYALCIDSARASADDAVTFWSSALGAAPAGSDGVFTSLIDAHPHLAIQVQAVDDEPRFHVDIETDDIEAETDRLLALGATVVDRPDGWMVLRAPSGHLLCVVPVQSSPTYFGEHATTID